MLLQGIYEDSSSITYFYLLDDGYTLKIVCVEEV